MSQAESEYDSSNVDDQNLLEDCIDFYRNYYHNEIAELAQSYPKDQKSLFVDWQDLYSFSPEYADNYLTQPEQFTEYLEEALRQFDLPVDVSLAGAHVRVYNLPESHQHYPNSFSPTKNVGTYQTITGDVLVSTETYGKITNAAFECQRCGTLTRIPQQDGDFQEPHECQGCERQGPFKINFNQSEFVDGETIQLQTPPEQSSGNGRTIQVFVEDDLTSEVEMGDRISVSGIVKLNQKTHGKQKTAEFIPYMNGRQIEIEDATNADVDISAETKERIEALTDGEEGNPLDVAAESFAPEVFGYKTEKKALMLAMVGGATNTPGVRGNFHVLFMGDPSTSKSILINKAADIAPRSLNVSSKNTTSSGLTSTATQGEFSDGRWTLSPGAFVKANEGLVAIYELDDMDKEDRASMLEPMANQQISVSKAGINATLSTQTTVVAAANPVHSHFDPYEPLDEQFGFETNLLSRFDLIFTFRDQPDPDDDDDVADHMTQFRDAKIRRNRGQEIPEEQEQTIETPVEEDVLTKWILWAKQQPDPVYESDEVRRQLKDSFVSLRGSNGYQQDDNEIPVTFRKLPGVERIARAHAKLEGSDVVTERHANMAMNMVGTSMQDYQTNEDGQLDSAITETGKSTSQHERKEMIVTAIQELQRELDNHPTRGDVKDRLENIDDSTIDHEIDDLMDKGHAYAPDSDQEIRYIGGA